MYEELHVTPNPCKINTSATPVFSLPKLSENIVSALKKIKIKKIPKPQ